MSEARVLVIIKVYPDDVSIDLGELAKRIENALPEGYQIVRKATEPIAFGLNALKLYILIPEETEGGTAKLEEILSKVEGVGEYEIEAVHRVAQY
ncbi:translation elongation factor aEF-1 beta [Pyrolobus fumarii 1A]|uniref:Elongation factor 1-beta n=1 Tax=Pyrolobus fumarii (strain DSM 11204 / 1A) TaxID=694429 RepID=G0EEE3_PYRF1|nr:elongation factor 1-beta [Pyrolobus fumarii]AEM37984.1 translation elongation factor aEF-1 beta [Pyrolobus fumarii 1A]